MTDTSSDRAVRRSFDNLYDATFQDVLSYCRRRTSSPEDANEATAETYLIAWRKFAELQATAKQVAWLLAVARQVILNQRRSNARRDRLVNRLQQQPRTLNVETSKLTRTLRGCSRRLEVTQQTRTARPGDHHPRRVRRS